MFFFLKQLGHANPTIVEHGHAWLAASGLVAGADEGHLWASSLPPRRGSCLAPAGKLIPSSADHELELEGSTGGMDPWRRGVASLGGH